MTRCANCGREFNKRPFDSELCPECEREEFIKELPKCEICGEPITDEAFRRKYSDLCVPCSCEVNGRISEFFKEFHEEFEISEYTAEDLIAEFIER